MCTLCPSQCNVKFTVRDDEKVLRVRPRDNHEVDDGWLCDKGRFGYQAIHSPDRLLEPMVRDGGQLRTVSWERAIADAAAGLKKAGASAAAIVGGSGAHKGASGDITSGKPVEGYDSVDVLHLNG